MSTEHRHHFEWNEIKKSIIELILNTADPVNEPEVSEFLQEKYGELKKHGKFDRSTVNKHLHTLSQSGCIEEVKPANKTKFKFYAINYLKNVEKILENFPDLIEKLRNNEFVLDTIIQKNLSLITNANEEYLNKISNLKFEINECKEHWKWKLKYSIDFFKLFLYSKPDDLSDRIKILADISGDDWSSSIYKVKISQIPRVDTLIYQNIYKVDLVFKACISNDVLQGQSTKEAIEYVKQLGNVVSAEQIEHWQKLYKNNGVSIPSFFRGKKLIPFENPELDEIEQEFIINGGKFI